MLSLIEAKDHLRKRVKRVRTSHGEEGIELTSGARLRFVARSTGSGRGFSGDCVILDEAYNLGAASMSALLPTLSARPNPQLWYASSAGMASSEQLLRVHERGVRGDSPRLAYFEFSADPELSLDDRVAWAQANPALGIRISEEYVESERAALGEWEFGRERLGYWPEFGVEQVINPTVWGRLANPESRLADPVVFAIDASPERDRACIAAAGVSRDDTGLLGTHHVEVVDCRPGTGWVPGRLAELVERWRPVAVVLNPARPAGSWLPELTGLGIDPKPVTGREFAQACGAFYEAVMERESLRHLDQEPLNSALSGVKKRNLGDSWVWHPRGSKIDVSPLVAATLALHGFMVYGRESAPPTLWLGGDG